jgi:hypothetical protein
VLHQFVPLLHYQKCCLINQTNSKFYEVILLICVITKIRSMDFLFSIKILQFLVLFVIFVIVTLEKMQILLHSAVVWHMENTEAFHNRD